MGDDTNLDGGENKKHLYNTRLSKTFWFAKRFGIRELFIKPLRVAFAPLILKMIPRRSFLFDGKEIPLFYHRYNITWAGERAVEVPVARNFLKGLRGKKVLEVGNVLSYYYKPWWDVLDKFEKKKFLIREDISNFKPVGKYDYIVSISTFEHIGFDDGSIGEGSREKILKGLMNIKKNCLKTGGLLMFTIPIGYNPEMDGLVFNKKMNFQKKFVKKVSKSGWAQIGEDEARKCSYGRPFPYGNCVAFVWHKNSSPNSL